MRAKKTLVYLTPLVTVKTAGLIKVLLLFLCEGLHYMLVSTNFFQPDM